MNFCEKIEKLLVFFNTTTAGLEKILGLSNGYLGNVEKKGTDNPGKLLAALNEKGISADWFLTGKGEMLLSSLPVAAKSEVAKTDEPYKVPLLRQQVSCGKGANWETEENIQAYVDILSLAPRYKHGKLFAFPAQGTSMIGAGIRNGDYVLFNVDPDQHLTDGIYVFVLDGEVYCKRLEFDDLSKKIKIYSVRIADLEKAELLATINIEEENSNDRFQILGRVVSWFHPNNDE
jgi:phage repressor protein C with HTH and peptisase S24 domain